MNFQGLPVIEEPQTYLEQAFSKAKKRALMLKTSMKKGDKEQKEKTIALDKIKTIEMTIQKHFERIVTDYPNFENLPDFYEELAQSQLDIDKIRQSLGRVQGVNNEISRLVNRINQEIKKSKTNDEIQKRMTGFYGRISSMVKQLKKSFITIENARTTLTTFPAIKDEITTIALAGFPNVGKSTILSKMTTAKPKIADYAFTTKTLNIGYYKEGHIKLQVIDTPGTLSRFQKMNKVEQQANLCLKYVADIVVFVIDPTNNTTIKEQNKLEKKLKELEKKIIYFISKTDIASEKEIKKIKEEYPKTITRIEELKKEIQKQLKEII